MPTFEFTSPEGKTYEVKGPEGATSAQAFKILQSQLGGGSQSPAAPAPAEDYSLTGDVLKSAGVGLGKGAIGLLGLPGDAAELATKGINAVAGTSLKNRVPLLTSGDIQHGVEKMTGKFYEPKSTLGQYAQTAGEFAPALIGGGEALIPKLAMRVAAPAIASETAGQLTQGTEAEPYARIAAGLGGGVAGAKFAASRAEAAAQAGKPTLDQVKAVGQARYNSPDITDVRFELGAVQNVSDQAIGALRKDRINDTIAPKTFKILEDLKTPVGPTQESTLVGAPYNPPIKASIALERLDSAHTYEDFQAARTQLNKLAGNFNDPIEQGAASKAISLLDRYTSNIPQSHLLSGDATKMGEALSKARADYAVAKTGERVVEKLTNAELRAASANSGANINNSTRQALRPLLTNKKQARGLTDEESALIENSVRGSGLGNTARTLGNYLGGGGGLGAMISGATGFLASGMNPLGLTAPLAGYGLKKIGDSMTRQQANKIVDQIMTRSPTVQAYMATLPPKMRNTDIAKRAALLGLLSQPRTSQGILPLNEQVAQ